MDNYSYNYRPDNLANSIQYIHQNYYNNISNSYQFYGLNAFDKENFIDYNDNNYPQTLFSRNNSHSLYLEEGKDFDVVNVKNIKKSILNAPNSKNHSKAPKDNNKIPQDSKKAKYNNDTINKYQFKPSNNNFNNITTINNNNYNKINSINIIFDANNIYNNDYLHYNDFNNLNDIKEIKEINDINIINQSNNQKININSDETNNNEEKEPIDNYKYYSDSLNQMNIKSCKSNNNLIRLKKNEKDKIFQDKSFTITNKKEFKMNSPKNKLVNKKKSKNYVYNNYSNMKHNKNNHIIKNKNIDKNKKYKKSNNRNRSKKIDETRTSSKLKNNSIKKIEKIKSNNNSIKKDNNLNVHKTKKNAPSLISYKNINEELHKYENNTKRTNKSKKNKTLRQTKSYVDKNKYIFLQRRNTYNKSELYKNNSFNISFGNFSKDREESNFAYLINEKKKRLFASFKQFDSVSINEENIKDIVKDKNKDKSKDKDKDKDKKLSKPKKNGVFNKKKKIKIKNINKNRINNKKNNINNEEYKIRSSIKTSIEYFNKISYKRLYSPQLSSNSLITNRNKEIIELEKAGKNISKKKNYKITRNITYNKSFNTKKKNLFRKSTNLSAIKSFNTQSTYKNAKNKFKSLNNFEDSKTRKKTLKNEYSNNILKTESNEKRKVNPINTKKISLNKSVGNVLKLSIKNNLKEFSKKLKEPNVIKKKHIRLENNNTASIFNIKKTNKSNIKDSFVSSNQTSTRKNKKKSNNVSLRNSSYKKSKKSIYNYRDYLNQKTARIVKKKVVYSRQKDNKEKENISNQKKNIYSFNKKTNKKKTLFRYNTFSEENRDIYNSSFKGFSASKKLEEIKKKYQFRPKTREKRNTLKEKNINYIEESKGFAQLISSANLLEDSLENNKKNLYVSENFSKINYDKNPINFTDNNIENNDNNIHFDIDMSDKSYILDLNNVIPINENEFIDTVNKTSLPNINDKGEKGINKKKKLSLINENIENEKKPVDNKDKINLNEKK